MFINMNTESEPHKTNLTKVAATIVAGTLLLVIISAITNSGNQLPLASADNQIGTVSNLGKALYGDYVLPFEITSILLLTAMVGAVMLGKKNVE